MDLNIDPLNPVWSSGPNTPRPAQPETAPVAVPEKPQVTEPVSPEELLPRIIAVARTCYDPEIPVNIYDLGLIYRIDVKPDGHVDVDMTLTSPACPVAGTLPAEVQGKIESVPGVRDVNLQLVWEPTWTTDKMTEAAKLQLGML